MKKISIEHLFLDLKTCERCIGTDEVLEKVIEIIHPILKLINYQVKYQKIEISSAELAERYHFLSSPTIRVNGSDIYSSIVETKCDCCSSISGVDVACRVFKQEEQTYEIPTLEILAETVLKAIFAPVVTKEDKQYVLPQNLKTFFKGKAINTCLCKKECD